jgi:uncharacterized protein
MGCLALFGIGLGWMFSPRVHRDTAPERPLRSLPPRTSFSAEEVARWMDQRLDTLWNQVAISSSSVNRETFPNQEREEEPWETRVLDVRLPKGVSLARASSGIEALSSGSPHDVQVFWVVEGAGFRGADLWVDGHLTHRVFLHEPPVGMQPQAPPPTSLSQVAVIVDDLGHAYAPFLSLAAMGAPITVAVLPRLSQSRRIAQEAVSRGMEVILHLPMEPMGYPDRRPGAGALMVSMESSDLQRVVLENLAEVPQAKGVNNHMGSRFTEDGSRMARVMELLESRGLYFVDSLTSPRSSGFQTAQRMGLRAYRRDVFLDPVQNEERIREQFERLLRVAKTQGYAIGICHPYPETLRILPELYRRSLERGYQWVTVSHLRMPGVDSEPNLASRRARHPMGQ